MNNFRRTVTEVVYIVKVTTHTIQKRLEEFKLTPTSELTVEEFLNNEFLEQAHDPPSYYEKQEEFIKNKKTRKRKRKTLQLGEDEPEAVDDDDPNKRQRTAESHPDTPVPSVELQKDADGFIIPPRPSDIPIDPELIDKQTESTLEQLADQFEERSAAYDDDTPTAPSKTRRGPDTRPIFVPPAWEEDELLLEGQITEMINDPNTREHSIAYARAKKRTDAYMKFLEAMKPEGTEPINMDTHIGPDEFAGDPEVENCLLSPQDIAIREKIWVNENRTWLRKQQIKATAKRNAANGPPKAKRNRQKKPRIGEGQTSPASTPGEAAEALLKRQGWSSKINYDVMKEMMDNVPGGRLGSLATSRATSRAPSSVSGSLAGSAVPSVASSVAESDIDDNESIAASDLRDDTSVADDSWKRELGQPHDDDFGGGADDDDGDEFGDGFGRDDDDDRYGGGDDDYE
jgi:transcription factor IIIB subunit 2